MYNVVYHWEGREASQDNIYSVRVGAASSYSCKCTYSSICCISGGKWLSGEASTFSLMISVYKSSLSPSLFPLYYRIYAHGSPLHTIATVYATKSGLICYGPLHRNFWVFGTAGLKQHGIQTQARARSPQLRSLPHCPRYQSPKPLFSFPNNTDVVSSFEEQWWKDRWVWCSDDKVTS
jgi:hypothetical protein